MKTQIKNAKHFAIGEIKNMDTYTKKTKSKPTDLDERDVSFIRACYITIRVLTIIYYKRFVTISWLKKIRFKVGFHRSDRGFKYIVKRRHINLSGNKNKLPITLPGLQYITRDR